MPVLLIYVNDGVAYVNFENDQSNLQEAILRNNSKFVLHRYYLLTK